MFGRALKSDHGRSCACDRAADPFAPDAAFALQVLGAVVHGDSSPTGGLSHLSSIWVQHPPGTFPRSLVLHSYEACVEG